MSRFDVEAHMFEAEVERVAADLVEQGTPPWKALGEAERIVSERRKAKAGARHD